tara:strand:+ start:998 stop:1159 length:162 start_codon:yes stop_codon:yes gene_type:complete
MALAYPVLASVDWAAFGLTVAAALAIFAAKQPVLRVIAGSAVAGVLLYLAGVA